jgi:hypothetical protein
MVTCAWETNIGRGVAKTVLGPLCMRRTLAGGMDVCLYTALGSEEGRQMEKGNSKHVRVVIRNYTRLLETSRNPALPYLCNHHLFGFHDVITIRRAIPISKCKPVEILAAGSMPRASLYCSTDQRSPARLVTSIYVLGVMGNCPTESHNFLS